MGLSLFNFGCVLTFLRNTRGADHCGFAGPRVVAGRTGFMIHFISLKKEIFVNNYLLSMHTGQVPFLFTHN